MPPTEIDNVSTATEYEKITYVWIEPRPRVEVPNRLTFRSLVDVGSEVLSPIVGRVLATSLDRGDQKTASNADVEQAGKQFLEIAREAFGYHPEWWQMAYDLDENLVGFVLPVLFRNSRKGNLDEGTFFHLGVTPEHRGKHYVYDLLIKGTQVLQEIGVWRIYTDTDVLNAPVIKAFTEAGYEQYGEPQKIPL